MTEHTGHYLCDTCRHRLEVGGCVCKLHLDKGEKVAINDKQEPHEVCAEWEAVRLPRRADLAL